MSSRHQRCGLFEQAGSLIVVPLGHDALTGFADVGNFVTGLNLCGAFGRYLYCDWAQHAQLLSLELEHKGRKPKLSPHQQREAIKRRDVDGETLRSIGRSYNVSAQTISRLTPQVCV